MPKAKISKGAWKVQWIESEAGWGQRNDGAWFYPTEEAAKKDTAEILTRYREAEAKQGYSSRNVPTEYSFPEEPHFVQVGDKLAAEIVKKGRAYRERGNE
jgi:hypothetical protein